MAGGEGLKGSAAIGMFPRWDDAEARLLSVVLADGTSAPCEHGYQRSVQTIYRCILGWLGRTDRTI